MITIINNNNYILGDYILINAPIFCKGFRGVREMIKKKNIEEDKYIFARQKTDNNWIIANGKSTKVDKVFFIESIINSIPELTNNTIEQNITDDKGIEKAPPIIYLSDNEKFKDECDNVLEIETRGVRNEDNIYFKVNDIEKQFDMPNLKRVIIDYTKSYELNIDYKFFLCEKGTNNVISTKKKSNDKPTIKKQLYLTYLGMLRMLFVSRNNKTRYFINWAKNILFAAQLGTTEQKDNEHNINIYEMKISSKDLIIDNKDLIIENLKKELYIKELELKLNK